MSPVGRLGLRRPSGPRRDDPFDLQDIFAARLGGDRVRSGRLFRVDRRLCDAKAITQVDENQPAVIAAAIDPSCQRDTLADVVQFQFTASMRFQHEPFLAFRYRDVSDDCNATMHSGQFRSVSSAKKSRFATRFSRSHQTICTCFLYDLSTGDLNTGGVADSIPYLTWHFLGKIKYTIEARISLGN